MRTRNLPAVLAAVVVLGAAAGNAFASTPECTDPSGTLNALQQAAANGGSFQLTCSLSGSDTSGQQLVVAKSLTLDLDGSDLSFSSPSAPAAVEVESGATLTLEDSSGSGATDLTAGPLEVESGATVAVGAGITLTETGTGTNAGAIALAGTLNGSGTLDNTGSISEAAPTWSVPGNGSGSLIITGNDYELTFSADFGSAPPALWAFAPTLSASGEALPDLPPPGYTVTWDAGDTAFNSSDQLSALATPVSGVNTVELSARYAAISPTITYMLSSKKRRGPHGWWLAPVKVTFSCSGPVGLTLECPRPITLRHSGKGFSASGTVIAANETSAGATAGGIKIDLTKPRVTIAGVEKGHVYSGKAPDAKCRARDSVSGISSCKLSKRIKRHHGGETITYSAIATSGSGRTAKATVSVTVALR